MITRVLLLTLIVIMGACDHIDALLQSVEQQLTHIGTITYHHEQFNYEIDYPADWVVEETDHGTELRSYNPDSIPPEYWERMPPGHARIVITPLMSADSTSLVDVIARDVQNMPPLGCLYDDPIVFTLDSGSPAVEIKANSEMGGDYSLIYTVLDERYFVVDVWARTNVEDIIRSLRPTTPSNNNVQRDTFENIHIEPQYYCQQ